MRLRIFFPVVASLCGCILPAHAQSFDCAKAATRYEKLICSNPDLSAADSPLAAAYQAAKAQLSPEGAQWLVRSQRLWLRHYRDSGKLDAKSVKSAYDERIKELQKPLESYGPLKIQWITMFGNANDALTFPRIESPATPETAKWNQFWVKKHVPDWWLRSTSVDVHNVAGESDDEFYSNTNVDITYTSSEVISVLVNSDSFSGGPHVNYSSGGSIFLLKPGRELTAADLLNSTTGWEKFFEDKVKHQAAVEEWVYDRQDSGIETKVSHWAISKEGLTIHFAVYEVDVEERDLLLSWAALKPYLKTPLPFAIPH